MNKLSLKEKIAQMFILGFSGNELNDNNENIQNAIRAGLGGVIFFADNLESREQFKKLTDKLREIAEIPLFMSIDQEGGLVERTIKLDQKIEYLTPMALCATGSMENVKIHTQIMADELKSFGINLVFAPVLDVNTNKNNPVIGIRAFSNDPNTVISYSETVYKTYEENNIIATGKHFPGHGEAFVDSHLNLPEIDINMDELEKIHIKPFEFAVNNALYAIMIAHVSYKAFNMDDKIPASLSYEVITSYLKNKLGFKGLIISDDMVMGGITKHYDRLDACIKAINAGIDILIFRESDDLTVKLIDQLAISAKNGVISETRINESAEKILNFKKRYKILEKPQKNCIDYSGNQKIIDKIALDSIKIIKKGSLLPLKIGLSTLILSPDKSQIYNYSFDKGTLSDFLNHQSCREISYSLNPDQNEINKLKNEMNWLIMLFL